MDDIFSRVNLIHAASGATGSVLSLSLFYPLDSLRTRVQVSDHSNAINILKEILEKEGIKPLYNGWFAVMCSICCSNFVYFYSYTALKTVLPITDNQTLRDLIAAFLAGSINVITTTPLWVANTRLKLFGSRTMAQYKKDDGDVNCEMKRYSGLLNCIIRIYKEEGITALWNGTMASLVLVCAPTIHFVVYEIFKRWGFKFYNSENLPGMFFFVIGGLAKIISTLLTYPLQVVQSRMRAGVNRDNQKTHSVLWILRLLISQGGLRALYSGLETKILQTVLTSAFMFLFYEKIVLIVNGLIKSSSF